MDNIVQVNKDLFLNISEAVKIEAHGNSFRISIRGNNGLLSLSMTAILMHPGTKN